MVYKLSRKTKTIIESVKFIFNLLISIKMNNTNKISNFKLEDEKKDVYLIYVVYDWPHIGPTGVYTGPDMAHGQ